MSVAIAELLNPSMLNKINGVAESVIEGAKKGLNPDVILMTDHAYSRAKSRFGLKEEPVALEHFRNLLKRAIFISETVCEETERRACMYGVRGTSGHICIIVSLDFLEILTVYNVRTMTFAEVLKDKVKNMYNSELRKALRKERGLLKKKPIIETDAYAKIYTSKLNILKTVSKKKIAIEKEIIAENEAIIANFAKELESIQSAIRSLARAVIGLIE